MNPDSGDVNDYSLRLMFPKFSKGHKLEDFYPFIEKEIGNENVAFFGPLSFPNQFEIVLKSKDIRAKLLQLSRVKINSRSCWITPMSQKEVIGFVHWLPETVSNEYIKSNFLSNYGEVMFIENYKTDDKFPSNRRCFCLKLKDDKTVDEIDHFCKVDGHRGWVQVTGRKSVACFHCEKVGHLKKNCTKFRRKLDSNCKRQRGKRYLSSLLEAIANISEVAEKTENLELKPESAESEW